MPHMKKTNDNKKVRDYARQVEWQKERYKTVRFNLLKDYEYKLNAIIEDENTTMAEWFRKVIDKEFNEKGLTL